MQLEIDNSNNMQVTTTSSLDGWKAVTHIGVATSHVVAGTGFLATSGLAVRHTLGV